MSLRNKWKSSAALLLVAFACYPIRTPVTWELPPAYSGWVYVQYENPACPPLPVEAGRRIIRISVSGRLCTSSRYETGDAVDEFVFVSSDGVRTKIPADEVSARLLHNPGNYESVHIGRPTGRSPDPSPFR